MAGGTVRIRAPGRSWNWRILYTGINILFHSVLYSKVFQSCILRGRGCQKEAGCHFFLAPHQLSLDSTKMLLCDTCAPQVSQILHFENMINLQRRLGPRVGVCVPCYLQHHPLLVPLLYRIPLWYSPCYFHQYCSCHNHGSPELAAAVIMA